MTTKDPAPAGSSSAEPTAPADVTMPTPRELAVSPGIGPLPPIHVAPPPSRPAVRLVRRAAAWAARLARGPATRHRHRDMAGE
jgi:hypothetical protein